MSKKDDEKKRKRSNFEKVLAVLVITLGLCAYAVSNVIINNNRNVNDYDNYPSETPDPRLSFIYNVIDSNNFECGCYVFTDDGISMRVKAYDGDTDAIIISCCESGVPCFRFIIAPPVSITRLDDSPIGSTIDNGTAEQREDELNWLSVKICELLRILPNCGNDTNVSASAIRDIIDSITTSGETDSTTVICGVYVVNFEYSPDNNSLCVFTIP